MRIESYYATPSWMHTAKRLCAFVLFLRFRSVRQFTHENSTASRDYEEVENGIKTCMYAGYPTLYMQFSKKNQFIFSPYWYRGIEYPKEQERGYASNEDLYVPGYFDMNMRKGESVVFAASTKKSATSSLKKLFDKEVEDRHPRNNFLNCLITAAHQFHNRRGEERYILAGYPWFKCRARDTFIAAPGLTLSIEEVEYFEKRDEDRIHALKQFYAGNESTDPIFEIDKPDVPLWCVWAIQQYADKVGKEKCVKMYGAFLKETMKFIESNKHPYMTVEDNGLLFVDGGKEEGNDLDELHGQWSSCSAAHGIYRRIQRFVVQCITLLCRDVTIGQQGRATL